MFQESLLYTSISNSQLQFCDLLRVQIYCLSLFLFLSLSSTLKTSLSILIIFLKVIDDIFF